MSFPSLEVDPRAPADLTVRGIMAEEVSPVLREAGVVWLASPGGEVWVVVGDDVRGAFRKLGARLRDLDTLRLRVDLPEGWEGEALEGLLLGLYRLRFPRPQGARTILLKEEFPGLAALESRMRGVYTARDLASWPANELSPDAFARTARDRLEGLPVEVEILDEAWLAREGFGGVLAVARGSHRPPRMLRLSYRPEGATAGLNLVGKGVVFDTGGINLKRVRMNEMVSMRQDKTGAAVVVGVVEAVARLGLPVRIEAAVPLVENMPGGGATRPGDVVRMYRGLHVEITNTDAEGRLILADALSWIQEAFPQTPTVDFATLTGAAVVALGKSRAPVFSNRETLQDALVRAGESVGERLWPLPVAEEYRELLRSPVADLVNSAGRREAGAVVAATFLWHFVRDDTPWAHIDIAGTGIGEGVSTGFGVRLMVRFLEHQVQTS